MEKKAALTFGREFMWLQQGHKQINILLAEHINNSQLIHQLNNRHK